MVLDSILSWQGDIHEWKNHTKKLSISVVWPKQFWKYLRCSLGLSTQVNVLLLLGAMVLPGQRKPVQKWNERGTSLVVQWLRICLPMQGTRVWALVREDPTYCGAAKPVHHNYWACALEPTSHNYCTHVLQLLKPTLLEPVLRNKRSHRIEKPVHHNEE